MMNRFFFYTGKSLVFGVACTVIGFSLYMIGSSLASVALQAGSVDDSPPLFSKQDLPSEPIAQLPVETDPMVIQMTPTLYASIGNPTDLAFDGEGTGFLLDASGAVVRIPAGGHRDSVPFLSLADEHTERSMDFSALTLHPGFLDSKSPGFGHFYCVTPEMPGKRESDFRPSHSADGEHHQEVIYEYRATDPRARIFSGTRREMMRFSLPEEAPAVSSLVFDAAGRLYISIADGGSTSAGPSQASRNAMELNNPFGKILRIDPLERDAGNGRYGVPRRNPFRFLEEAMPELWSYGLRSPYGLSVDGMKGELCILDKGKDGIEEINLSSLGGEHFGWDLCEGSYYYPPAKGERAEQGVTIPAVEFLRGDALTGALMYRGNLFTELSNRFVFATASGRLWMAEPQENAAPRMREISVGLENSVWSGRLAGIRALRPGSHGEIFALCNDGAVFVMDKASRTTSRPAPRRPLMAWAF
ncbi:MAG: PQQ-dependent sugar dehydrogenase [Verrucomicrobiales bacterium]|nr:PQQ-dependent sugar dehydrogenase [Verrucomicrobiales bacterium]